MDLVDLSLMIDSTSGKFDLLDRPTRSISGSTDKRRKNWDTIVTMTEKVFQRQFAIAFQSKKLDPSQI